MAATRFAGNEAEAMMSDLPKNSFLTQASEDSNSSGGTTAYSLGELSSPAFFSNKCLEIDAMASRVVDGIKIKSAIREAVADGKFCVTIADPRDPDMNMVAVSKHFANMTGYQHAETVGRDCRFLSTGCETNLHDLGYSRKARRTGAACAAVFENGRKSGELSLSLVDLCGLTVGQNLDTQEELWFLVGIHADVTNITELPGDRHGHIIEAQRIACHIRAKLADEPSALAVWGALNGSFAGYGPRGT